MNSRIFLRVALVLTFLASAFTGGAQVIANFSATPLSGCTPLIVRFTDLSTGNPTSWTWDLGNGTISFLQNPSVLYFTPGKYTIKLVAKNATGADSVVKTDYIEVFAKPSPAFSVSDTAGCYPLPVQFTDNSVSNQGSINSWLWDFGDGATSTEQNPSHTYTSARNFSVTLQIKNTNGCISTLIRPSLVKINTGVLAQFRNDNPQTCTAPVTINFQNQSTGTGVVNYLWDFGDNTSSTLLNPSHTFSTQGSYTVKLIVTNSNGCSDTTIKTNAVTIGTVRANFTSANTGCQGTGLQFTNTSAPAPASVLWQFGDGTTSTVLSPVKNYSTAGTYTVKMVANFGACTDSLTKTITVLPRPLSIFSTADTVSCKAPLTVNFTNQAVNAVSYLWYFGDNTTSTLPNPSHTYNNTGNYTVRLVVTNTNGCNHSLIKSNYIRITNPSASITNLPDSGCVPFTKNFNVTVNTSDPIVSYLWDLGDGNTSGLASPVNTYNNEGTYNVSVVIITASGCTDTASITRAIVTNTKPVPGFTATPTTTCAKIPVQFTDSSTGGPTKWLWDFGDKTTSTLQNPLHSYVDTGYFDIKLTVWKGGCADSILIPRFIRINPPVAKFIFRNNCNKPFEKIFTDQSLGADEWLWDFGDGNVSATQSPVHTYSNPGFYTVTLKVINNTYGCDFTTTRQLRVIDAAAQFTASDTVICRGSVTNFTTGLSDIRTFSWTFGDGSPSQNSAAGTNLINYTYTTTGTFTVRLITSDRNGCLDTLTKINYITVNGPIAKFAPAVPGACLNNAVIFNDSSVTDGIHPIQQWKWNYGDGTIETLTATPFQHTYAAAGAYGVKLQVTDSKGCTDSFNLAAQLIISKPAANFTSVDTFSCPGRQVRFVNQSTGPGLTYRWHFGDNSTSTAQNPSHIYNQDGSYTIKLTVTDQYGCSDSVIKAGYISVTSPVARFDMSDSAGNCPPLIINFTDRSTNVISRKWDFGDSTSSTTLNPVHFYNYPGTYFVRLTITGLGGCTSTYQRSVVIKGPEGHFTYLPLGGCKPVNVNFTASTNGRNSFVWDFNDGSILSGADSVVSHAYTYPGKYVPKMILIDQAGCQVPIRGLDTIVVSGIDTRFGFNNKLLCDSGIISFSDSSTAINDIISGYRWSFGDGAVDNRRHPVHEYTSTGIYYPSLITATQQGCTDTLRSSIPVKIVASPKINIISSANGCTPLAVTFSSELLIPDTSVIRWKWNFANGTTSVVASPLPQNYTTAGIYTINLTGTNSSGCRDSVTKNIEAYAIPLVTAGQDVILCRGSSLSLQATGATNYSWTPATGLSCTNCPDPATSVSANISYIVTGTSAQGCSAKDTVAVTVKNKFVFTYGKNDSLCRGQSKNLSANGAYSYSWAPANSLSNASISNPVATPDSNTVYRVIGADDLGCFKDTGYIPIRVNPMPTVEAGLDRTINVGQPTLLLPLISADVVNVNWQPNSGLFRNLYPGIEVKPLENTEYRVEVTTKGGCMARDRVTVFVICNGSNIFIPNTFSPNDDGTNDIFYPRGTGLFKIKNLRIFTRWGEVIYDRANFDANNPTYGWDGTNKGIRLNPDVFVYTLDVICDNGSVLTYRGNVALVK